MSVGRDYKYLGRASDKPRFSLTPKMKERLSALICVVAATVATLAYLITLADSI